MTDFVVGEKVFFRKNTLISTSRGQTVTNYICNPTIPDEYIIHGSTEMHESYNTRGATIVDFYEDYCIVEFFSDNNKNVRLGFKPEQLKRIFTTWKERYKRD